MGSATDYFENIVLDSILGDNCGANVPSSVWVGLLTSSPSDASGGVEVSTSGTGYARVLVLNDTDHWPDAVSSTKQNAAPIQFATATAAWGAVSYVGIYDSDTGGNLLLWGELSFPVSPVVGNAPYFAPGSPNITCD